jgi:outer membrane biogenesis lipoprotein LolB
MPKSPNSRSLKHTLLIAVALVLTGCAQGPVLRVQSVAQQSYPPSSVVETLRAAPSRPYIN